jgi:hypothetical protein
MKRRLRTLAAIVTLPPTLLHELVHAVVAARAANESVVVIDASGIEAFAGIDWDDNVPAWLVVASHYGPFVLGVTIAMGAVVLGSMTAWKPATVTDWTIAGTLAVWWTIFTLPSSADRINSSQGGQSQ